LSFYILHFYERINDDDDDDDDENVGKVSREVTVTFGCSNDNNFFKYLSTDPSGVLAGCASVFDHMSLYHCGRTS